MTGDEKAARRKAILAARRAVSSAAHAAEARQLCAHLDIVARGAGTTCAYVPTGAEPGSLMLLERLRELCSVVLVPVTRTGPDGEHLPLQWGPYEPGLLVPARWGLSEPPEPWLPARRSPEPTSCWYPHWRSTEPGFAWGAAAASTTGP